MEKIETLIKKIDNDLKDVLSEERYKHCIGVMNKAGELAEKYNVDVNKARLVGLAHDIAKEMTHDDKLKYVKENEIQIDDIEKINVGLLHAKIGADICKKRYGFTQEMQDAITYHTTGNKNMDDLAKILIVADKAEDGRTWEDSQKVREIADKSLDEAVIYIIDVSIKNTIDKNKLIHTDSIDTRNKLLLNNM